MSMPVLAFFRRSLRTQCRQFRTYLFRIVLLVFMLGSVVSAHSSPRFSFLGAPGLMLFQSVISTTLWLICLAAPFYFASVITEEKEGMPLGFLKMAGLSPTSILLGTSTSQLLTAVMLLLAQAPFAVLAVTLGGVSMPQVVAAYVALVAHLVFVANLALLCSTVCRRTSRAAGLTVFFLVAFFIGPFLGKEILGALTAGGLLSDGGIVNVVLGGLFGQMRRASAFGRSGVIMATGFSEPPIGFQVLSNLALGLGCFLLSWAVFDVFTRELKVTAPGRGLAFRRTSRLRRLGVGRPWRNALAWKDFNFMTGGLGGLLLKFVLFGLIIALIEAVIYSGRGSFDVEELGAIMVTTMVVVITIQISVLLSRVFSVERKERALVSIMVLPRSTLYIVYSKVFGCLLALAPAVAYFCVGILLLPEPLELFTSPLFWVYVPQALLFFNLVAYFSLVLRRGGLLLAVVAWIVGAQILSTFVLFPLVFLFGMGLPTGPAFVAQAVFFLAIAGVFHLLTLRRLQRVAAE